MASELPVRLKRGAGKIVNAALWKALAARLPTPKIETVYDGEGTVYRLDEPGFIEPSSGYVITQKGVLIEDSMRPNFHHKGAQRLRPFKQAVPSLPPFLAARRQAADSIVVDSTTSVRHFWEWNYYHFYFDVLGFLQLLDTQNMLPRERPLVAAKYLDDIKFGREIIQQPGFATYQWLTPTTQFISAQEIYYGVTQTAYKDRVRYINRCMEVTADFHQETRVFLTRNGNRRIVNMGELQPILDKHGFDVVDTSGMSVKKQAQLFGSVRYLIANHGAGTTNIIFRGEKPLSVLELHSDRCMNFDHKRICTEFGHAWDSLQGTSNVAHPANFADFSVDPDEVEQKIVQLLAS